MVIQADLCGVNAPELVIKAERPTPYGRRAGFDVRTEAESRMRTVEEKAGEHTARLTRTGGRWPPAAREYRARSGFRGDEKAWRASSTASSAGVHCDLGADDCSAGEVGLSGRPQAGR